MWCTRWYLPLVLLPFPIAPPFFLWLFLFSLTLHARPCFYCIVLLSAMFVSSCYWPPVPLESPLTVPWSENITTYADALVALLPTLPEAMKPANVPMLDRCWCDIPSAGAFIPFNVTRWEQQSVLRLKGELEEKMKSREKDSEDVAAGSSPRSQSTQPPPDEVEGRSRLLSGIWESVWPFARESAQNMTAPPLIPHNASLDLLSRHPEDLPSVTDANNSTNPTALETLSQSLSLPLLRREYDLRSYGFALILDFGWSTPA